MCDKISESRESHEPDTQWWLTTAQIALLPLVLVPTTLVSLAAALHIVSLRKLSAAAVQRYTAAELAHKLMLGA